MLLDMAISLAQIVISLASCQTRRSWVWLQAKPNKTQVWQAVRPFIFGFGCAPSLIGHGSSELLNSSLLGLVARQPN